MCARLLASALRMIMSFVLFDVRPGMTLVVGLLLLRTAPLRGLAAPVKQSSQLESTEISWRVGRCCRQYGFGLFGQVGAQDGTGSN